MADARDRAAHHHPAAKRQRCRQEELHDLVRFHGERSVIPLTNFYGIEIKSFAAEIARLALLMAEFQSDVNYIGQKKPETWCCPYTTRGGSRRATH